MKKLETFKPEIGVSFKAGGKKYIIEKDLSIERAIMLNKLEIEVLNNTSYGKIKSDLIEVYNTLNEGRFADSAMKVYNLAYGMEKEKIEEMPVLRVCALFINEENEDRRSLTEDAISSKIQDWQESGYSIEPFFVLALTFLPSVGKDFKQRIQNILNQGSKGTDEK